MVCEAEVKAEVEEHPRLGQRAQSCCWRVGRKLLTVTKQSGEDWN